MFGPDETASNRLDALFEVPIAASTGDIFLATIIFRLMAG